MTREIKFRVWDNTFNEYKVLGMNTNNQNLGLGFEVSGGIGSNVTTMYHSVGDAVEQYTGMADKNGVEIYEGDIICQQMRFVEANGVICWQEDKARFTVNFGVFGTTIAKLQEHSYEVIGNIHENADLLEVEE